MIEKYHFSFFSSETNFTCLSSKTLISFGFPFVHILKEFLFQIEKNEKFGFLCPPIGNSIERQ